MRLDSSLLISAFVAAAAVGLVGCDSHSPVVCTALAEPAVVVEVTDAGTGDPIAAEAVGYIAEGSYRDSLRHHDIEQMEPELIVRSLAAGYERPGTYDVRVEREGYETWTREDVRVPVGECGPETVQLEAELDSAS